jgi:modulator of FtsH protease HflK
MTDEIIDLQDFRNRIKPRVIFGIFVAIVVLLALFSSFYTVDQEEEAVVLVFGKYDRTTGPGLHFKMPFGMEKNYNVPTQRVLKEEFGFRTTQPGIVTTYSTGNYEAESVMLTGDLNIADVTWIIQYRIKDPYAWLFHVEDQARTIRDISQSVINLLVGDLAVFDVVTTERTRIEQKGQDMMNTIFDRYKMGIRVVTVKLQKTMYPKGAVQDAFEDVNKAIQDRIRLINEGKEAYNNLIPKARGEAERTLREAEGYAIEKINQAKGDVARFLAVLGEYKKNPNVTRIRLYYDMFGAILGNSEDTDLIDKQLENFLSVKSLTKEKKGDKQ